MWNGALSMGTGLSSSWANAGCASTQESTNNDAEITCLMEFLPFELGQDGTSAGLEKHPFALLHFQSCFGLAHGSLISGWPTRMVRPSWTLPQSAKPSGASTMMVE